MLHIGNEMYVDPAEGILLCNKRAMLYIQMTPASILRMSNRKDLHSSPWRLDSMQPDKSKTSSCYRYVIFKFSTILGIPMQGMKYISTILHMEQGMPIMKIK